MTLCYNCQKKDYSYFSGGHQSSVFAVKAFSKIPVHHIPGVCSSGQVLQVIDSSYSQIVLIIKQGCPEAAIIIYMLKQVKSQW